MNGTFNNIPFHIAVIKEPENNMLMICTHGSLARIDDAREKVKTYGLATCELRCSENVHNHFLLRDSVNKHKSKRHDGNTHDGMNLDNSWKMHRWATRLFIFSCYHPYKFSLVSCLFSKKEETIVMFCKKLAYELR